jgi:hypothetical protein
MFYHNSLQETIKKKTYHEENKEHDLPAAFYIHEADLEHGLCCLRIS